MGRKKRTSAPNPTPPPPDAARRPAAGIGGEDAAVRAEVDKALACLQRGNHARALRLMKDALARHGEASSPLLLRAHGTVHARAASVLDDPAARARHHRAALQAAQRAVELAPESIELAHFHAMLPFDAANDARAASVLDDPAVRARHHRAVLQAAQRDVELAPESIELAHFHAMLLFDAANDGCAYEEVVAECERDLSIEVPSDPSPHSLRLPGPLHSVLRRQKRRRFFALQVACYAKCLLCLPPPLERVFGT